jgi:hypothetical protein
MTTQPDPPNVLANGRTRHSVREYGAVALVAALLFSIAGPALLRSDDRWAMRLALLVVAAVGSFTAASFLLLVIALSWFGLRNVVSWLRRDPLRHTVYVLVGVVAIVCWGLLASALGLGGGESCEPDGRGGVSCFDE